MKRILFVCLMIMAVVLTSTAQIPPDYPPAPLPPGNVTRVEYFIRSLGGTDPGFGSGIALGITPQQNISAYSEGINLSALPQGYYRISLRSLDADGKWSLTNHGSTFDYVVTPVYPTAPPAVTNIVRLEYAIDANIQFGNGTPIAITPATNIANLNAVIDLTGIPQGPHILYIRSLDADGKWSLTNISFFDNSALPPYPSAPPAPGNIQQLEYFIDTDPGFGVATPISFTPGTDVTVTNFSIPTTGLSSGIHQLCIRSRNNPWAVTTVQSFLVGIPLPVTWLYVKGQLVTQGARIEWATASESNTDKFEIEHSADGINYTKAGTTAAAGNSTSTSRYEFIHPSPVSGKNYYRIKQIDIDGRFTYSAVIVLYNITARNVLITPNPVQYSTVIYFKETTNAKTISLLTAGGQAVLTRQIMQGVNSYALDMSNLPAGMYILQVQTSNETATIKVIKQ